VRLIGYTRSSDAREHEESHAGQETTIRAWARDNGHRIVRVISEPAGTRGTTTKRDGWADVLNALEDDQGDGIVVRELERLSRDVLVQEQLMRDVWGQDKEVLSTAPSEADLRDDPEDPTRRLIRIIIGAVHAHNRDMTVLRMQRGKRRKQQRGGYLGGTARYGYHPVDKELTPDQAEGKVAASAGSTGMACRSARSPTSSTPSGSQPNAAGAGTRRPSPESSGEQHDRALADHDPNRVGRIPRRPDRHHPNRPAPPQHPSGPGAAERTPG
jgi:DNA invertase Pin-like site-specific DNA recombinase